MIRNHYTWFSPWLQRQMDILVYGTTGVPVLFFPTRTARYFDYEDWRVLEGISDKINAGYLQIYCVDSCDTESFYNQQIHPSQIIPRHLKYERYILDEVMEMIRKNNPHQKPISAGCSLGAYHAANIAFRYPLRFCKILAMSGRYDLTIKLEFFEDLFNGYRDENVYFHMPTQYLPNITDERILHQIRKLDVQIVIGKEDAFLPNNYDLSNALHLIGIKHELHLWEEEAHRARYWKEMVKVYL